MRFNTLLMSMMVFMLIACEKENTDPDTEPNKGSEKYKTDGYVVSAVTPNTSGSGGAFFAGYFKELPTGDLDLTQFSSYPGFYPRDRYKNFMYGQNIDKGGHQLNRYAVDNTTGKIVKAGLINLPNFLATARICNDELGVFTIRDSQTLYLFNPMTMETTGTIPMPNAKTVETAIKGHADDAQDNSYYSILYRKQDNKLFLPLSTNHAATGPFYDAKDVFVEVVDLNAKKWVKTITVKNATQPISRGYENNVVDEQGNVYITCQGQYGMDALSRIAPPPGSRPEILKIPAGSTDFDQNYRFNPAETYKASNKLLFAQFLTGTIYGKNGIAYAAVSSGDFPPRVLEILKKVSKGENTPEEFNELRSLVMNGPNSIWVKIDLKNQTVSDIPGMKQTAGFGYPLSEKVGDKLYFQVFNPALGMNGTVEYDQASNQTKELYKVKKGGLSVHFVKLSK